MGLWTAVPDDVLTNASLSVAARLLYGILCSHARKDRKLKTRVVEPNEQHLKAEMGVSLATVKRAMAELLEAGLIERQRRLGSSSITTIPVAPDELTRAQNDTDSGLKSGLGTEKDKERIQDSPSGSTPPDKHVEMTHSDPEIVEDPLAEPPTKAQAAKKRHYATGHEIAKLYDKLWVSAGAPPRSTDSPGVLVDASKHFEGLRHTKYAGQSVKEVMAWGAARFADAYRAPAWAELWAGSRHRPAGADLARFLDGRWERHDQAADDGKAEFEAVFGGET